jgi:NUMOD3 motif
MLFYNYIYVDPRYQERYEGQGFCLLYRPIYVGKGSRTRHEDHLRPSRLASNTKFHNTLRKLLVDHDMRSYIIRFNWTESETFLAETTYIQNIGRDDLKTGPLFNLTDGGDGASGAKRTEEQKEKYSQSLLGKNKGKERTNLARQRMSLAGKGRPKSEEHKQKISIANRGKRHTQESRLKMKKAKLGRCLSIETRQKMSAARILYLSQSGVSNGTT